MNSTVLRLLDANANRAREALRVTEDFARFVLNDGELAARLKEIRHDLADVLKAILPDALPWRDTPGDVGKANKTNGELTRQDIRDVVTAAGKRLGEALRAIEEYLKTTVPADAVRVEQLRYRFYDIEQRLARPLLGPGRFAEVRLYVLITETCCRRPWLEAAEEALIGGADCLQLRERGLDAGRLLTRARQLVDLCRRYRRLCIINDRPDIAILSDADGVHVGQEDLPAVEVRKLVGRDRIVGVSTHHLEQAKRAWLDGADYIGVGPMFPSTTKPREFVAGIEYAVEVVSQIPIPAVAIAGITLGNVDKVLSSGVPAVAVTAAVLDSDDPRSAAAEFKRRLSSNVVGQTLAMAQRRLPHWTMDGSTYFITFRVLRGELTGLERKIVLDHVKSGADRFYTLIAATVMPDHVHVLLTPRAGWELSRIMKGMKGVSAHLLNQHRREAGRVWQDESWDRIVRDQKELDEKLEYMLDNPVKKELVSDPWQYDGWYYNEVWQTRMSAPH